MKPPSLETPTQAQHRTSSQTCRVCCRLIMAGQETVPDVMCIVHRVHVGCVGGGAAPSDAECREFDEAIQNASET